ncbi:hypothetical protein CFN78_22775 [Amycolatopsis antarctica]|uniref:DUF4393 domain-containing protein n=1 Tax=Amycolatopsis antarctica TaxID=1854586 RepID=A0A263D119_9PSEU|nr:Abi-alpha family protein [Amycolatopsis antarctica]OZM71035.1 hypothetical protein CFN78_22775 [Amycolatopsis antarctica]
MVTQAGRLAGWAARTGFSVARRLPGVGVAERGARELERRALVELRKRLENVNDSRIVTMGRPAVSANTAAAPFSARQAVAVVPTADGEVEPLRGAMAELLNRSIGFGRERSREYLYAVILRQLTPDEARILATLAEGSPFPVVDIVERGGIGGTGRVLLANASTVGKSAGVSLLDHVADYVSRLAEFGLVDIGPEVSALDTQYEILMTDDEVAAAEKTAKRPKAIRRSVRISRLGAEFWRACDPTGGLSR